MRVGLETGIGVRLGPRAVLRKGDTPGQDRHILPSPEVCLWIVVKLGCHLSGATGIRFIVPLGLGWVELSWGVVRLAPQPAMLLCITRCSGSCMRLQMQPVPSQGQPRARIVFDICMCFSPASTPDTQIARTHDMACFAMFAPCLCGLRRFCVCVGVQCAVTGI